MSAANEFASSIVLEFAHLKTLAEFLSNCRAYIRGRKLYFDDCDSWFHSRGVWDPDSDGCAASLRSTLEVRFSDTEQLEDFCKRAGLRLSGYDVFDGDAPDWMPAVGRFVPPAAWPAPVDE